MVTRQEVVDKITAYVTQKYGGDWRKAFDAEDSDGDGRISTTELTVILAKAGVGLRLTRWAIALQIVDVADGDGDGFVDFKEFEAIALND